MERIKPTRSELLKTKRRIKIARKGHELLKKKQDSLVMEFFALLKEVKSQRADLQEAYEAAQRRMNEARAMESDFVISAASLAISKDMPLDVSVKNIAGVRIPEIAVGEREQLAPFGGVVLQELSGAYQSVVGKVLELAARETALRKMLIEIKKTKRRAHALEHVLLPRLEEGKKRIIADLEEREREEFNRLKKRKQ